jgi:translation elongation factor EF-1alpha
VLLVGSPYTSYLPHRTAQDPAFEAQSFTVQIFVIHAPNGIRAGHTPTFCCGSYYGPVKVDQILSIVDRKTGAVMEPGNNPRLNQGQSALLRMVPSAHQGSQRVCVESYALYPSLGAVAFLDRHRSVCVRRHVCFASLLMT